MGRLRLPLCIVPFPSPSVLFSLKMVALHTSKAATFLRRGTRRVLVQCAFVAAVGAAAVAVPNLAYAKDPSGAEALQKEAEQRYRRALELFNSGDYDASLLEFRRAYELAPTYRILYNIALVNVQMNDYAGALDAFERFLAEGADEAGDKRRGEVRATIESLQGKIGTLEVVVDQPGTEVFVDDLSVGITPLDKPLRLNVGRRRITVVHDRERKSQIAEVAGKDQVRLVFSMEKEALDVEPEDEPKNAEPAPDRTPMYLAWGATGAFALGAVSSGVMALNAKSKQKEEKARLGVTEGELNSAAKKVKALALTTDILSGATVAFAGVALYITLKSPKENKPDEVVLVFRPQGAEVRGTF